MLQKETFSTTSSKSGTSKGKQTLTLNSPVQFLKGVGPKLSYVLSAKGIATVSDLIHYLPRTYQDRSKIIPLNQLTENQPSLVAGQIISHRFIPIRKLRRPMLQAVLQDTSGVAVQLKWFQYNRTYFETKLNTKPFIVAFGTPKRFGPTLGFIHADVDWDADPNHVKTSERILPVYSESEGLSQKTIRKLTETAVNICLQELKDDLPLKLRQNFKLPDIKTCLKNLHSPQKNLSIEELLEFRSPEQKRLIFEELFKFEWIIGRRRLNLRREHTKPYRFAENQNLYEQFCKNLKFELTNDQKNSIEKIYNDLSQDKPMNRLLQGDVGCGKTAVAFASILPVVANQGQAVLMAPTEILAEQHLKNARNSLEKIVHQNRFLRVEMLVGSTTKSQRDQILADLKSGTIDLLIGTHAVFEDPVIFNELGLILIDEQHRFGVDQRLRLRSKGKNPHVLSLTATPIPRTLALTAFGDLDVSIIKELPKGRPPIFTKSLSKNDKSLALDALKKQLGLGRQGYVIYPLVEESEKLDLSNAIEGAEELANDKLKGFSVGLLHGRMSAKEKSDVMDRFKKGQIQVLVSTTVVEVGVDVPNATVLIIEHSERFGLSQLHQLRGRIGRGTEDSFCFLIHSGGGQISMERLAAMEQTRDGFKLAELDLEIRGPGEFLGTKQSGELQFKYASLTRDLELLQEARHAAFELLQKDPDLQELENEALRRYMIERGHLQQMRFQTA